MKYLAVYLAVLGASAIDYAVYLCDGKAAAFFVGGVFVLLAAGIAGLGQINADS